MAENTETTGSATLPPYEGQEIVDGVDDHTNLLEIIQRQEDQIAALTRFCDSQFQIIEGTSAGYQTTGSTFEGSVTIPLDVPDGFVPVAVMRADSGNGYVAVTNFSISGNSVWMRVAQIRSSYNLGCYAKATVLCVPKKMVVA